MSSSLALLHLVQAGGATACRRALLDQQGGPDAAQAGGPAAWQAAGLDASQIEALRRPDRSAIATAQAWLDQPRHHLLGWHDPDYPPLLRRCGSPPLALFVDGDPARLWHPAVAVVGSRAPSAGGRDNATAFSRAMVAAGLCVVSGLAAGVDGAAHQAALSVPDGLTVAVLGTGPDLSYPRQHAALRERIAERGAVVSEHLPGTEARPSHFPSRNRILAGLSLATLVVEAAERSGALITARQASDYGREVFAIPGSIHNPLARGSHRLIREGAGLVESAREILDVLAPQITDLAHLLRARLHEAESGPTPGPPMAGTGWDADYHGLWLALGHDPTSMDCLVERTGLTAAELSSMLLVMELDGRVSVEHGRYCRKN